MPVGHAEVLRRGSLGPLRGLLHARPLRVAWQQRRRASQLEHITSGAAICHGQPTVRGLRYPVQLLLALLSAGMSIDDVLADHPDLQQEDLLAALECAASARRPQLTTWAVVGAASGYATVVLHKCADLRLAASPPPLASCSTGDAA